MINRNSYVSTDAKRVVRVEEVTLDSQDNKSIINDTLTDDLENSIEHQSQARTSQKKKNKKSKRAKKQYLNNSVNDSQYIENLTHIDSEGSIIKNDLMRNNLNN